MSLCGGSDSPSHGLQTVPHVSVSAPVKSPEACTADPDPRPLHYVTNNQHVSHTFAADPRVSRVPLGGGSAATDGPSYVDYKLYHTSAVLYLSGLGRQILLTQFIARYHAM